MTTATKPKPTVDPAVSVGKTGKRTTINVSVEFAEAVTGVAGDDGMSVADFCDGKYLPDLKKRYVGVLREKLKAFERDLTPSDEPREG